MGAPFSFPTEVKRALERHDPRLRVAWDPLHRHWVVAYLARRFDIHPKTVFAEKNGRKRPEYWIEHRCVDEFGEARSPNWDDYRALRAKDFESHGGAKQYLSDMESNADRKHESRIRHNEDKMAEGAGAVFDAMHRIQIGYGS